MNCIRDALPWSSEARAIRTCGYCSELRHHRAASTTTTNSPPTNISHLPHLSRPILSSLSQQPHVHIEDARHDSRDAVTRDSHCLGCAARAPLRSRSLRPPGKRDTETSCRCASGTERWQECQSVEQLRRCVDVKHPVRRLDNTVGAGPGDRSQ